MARLQLAEAPLLDVRGLSIEIKTIHGVLNPVRSVDLMVRRGETHAIVGESGCGKSLTSLALMGLMPGTATVTADRMELSGTSLKGLSNEQWRELRGTRVAMIFQDPMTSLDPCYTIGNQMIEILQQHQPVSTADARARSLDMLSKVGMPSPRERLDQYPHQLSGGLRQRVMIAMALLCEPELIFADEPTTALDVTIQAQILQLLGKIRDETGIGIVLITHDLGVVASIADSVSVMYGGQIVETAATDELLANPTHPYTEGLLRAMPVPGKTRRGEPLGFIPGVVPRQSGALTRCGFMERCPYQQEACQAPVPLRARPDGRLVRCILPEGSPRSPEAWTRFSGVS